MSDRATRYRETRSWDTSPELILGEFMKLLEMARTLAEWADEADTLIEEMQEQHDNFINHFGKRP